MVPRLKAADRRDDGAERGRECGPLRRQAALDDGEKTQMLSHRQTDVRGGRLGFDFCLS